MYVSNTKGNPTTEEGQTMATIKCNRTGETITGTPQRIAERLLKLRPATDIANRHPESAPNLYPAAVHDLEVNLESKTPVPGLEAFLDITIERF